MEIKNVVNNGVQIPNECTCIWCGSKMRRGGANRMGAGVNSFALWCNNCGAAVSYTHLTLPTNREVQILGDVGYLKKKKKR